MPEFIFMGDSWALKGFTDENWQFANRDPMPGDTRLADHWGWQYDHCLKPGHGNLACLEKFKTKNIDPDIPLIWVYTEPGRDYNIITGRPEFEWIESEEIFEIRKHLERETFKRIKNEINNPIGFIGGYSDLDVDLVESYGYTVLHPSWQRWIAEKLGSQWFRHGWGAGDIGWRADYNNVKPSKSALFAWDDQIKEWCWWTDEGYFCHEHPTPRANEEFAKYLQPTVEKWIDEQRR